VLSAGGLPGAGERRGRAGSPSLRERGEHLRFLAEVALAAAQQELGVSLEIGDGLCSDLSN